MKRFNIFFGLPLLTLILVIAACGGSAEPTVSSTPNEAVQPADTTATIKSAEERVLKVAMTFLDEPPDPYQAGWLAVPTGLSETLFRLNEDLKPVPWLAAGATQVDSRTWEITLREGVKFHNGVVMDGSKV